MKNHYINSIFVLAMVIAIASCQKNKDASNATKSSTPISVLGKWKIVSLSSSLVTTKGIDPFVSTYQGTVDDYYDFKEDGTVNVKQGKNMVTAEYSVDGNLLMLKFPKLSTDSMVISMSAGSMTLTMEKQLPFGQTFSRNNRFSKSLEQ